VIVLLVLTGLLTGACASARRPESGPSGVSAPATAAATPAAGSLDPDSQTCEDRVREERKTEIIRAGVNTGLLAGAWMVLYGGAQGAFWGLLSGTRDGAWIGAAVGAGVGLLVGVVNGIEAARQVEGQLTYAPSPCPTGADAALSSEPLAAHER
jgi:hypothetical protein